MVALKCPSQTTQLGETSEDMSSEISTKAALSIDQCKKECESSHSCGSFSFIPKGGNASDPNKTFCELHMIGSKPTGKRYVKYKISVTCELDNRSGSEAELKYIRTFIKTGCKYFNGDTKW